MIALLCSVEAEADLLLAKMSVTGTAILGSKTVAEGILAGRKVAICIGGMGKVNAAHAATILFTRYSPEALILFGVGGAYPASGARTGDILVAGEEIAGDEGVLVHDGFKDTEYIGIPLLRTATSVFFNVYPAPELLVRRVMQNLVSLEHAGKVYEGRFVTVSTCSGTASRARELEQRYNGVCENMEGAAAAHVAVLHGVPWLEVRAVSNLVEDRDLGTWDVAKAAAAVQRAVVHLLERWDE